MKSIACVALTFFAVSANADGYRCLDNGRTVFQATPCRVSPPANDQSAADLQAEFERWKAGKATTSARSITGRPLAVPSDARAAYLILETPAPPTDRMQTITTRRAGNTGNISYSTRLYDCLLWQVKYVGTGETIEAMKASRPDKNMAGIVDGSIADYVGREACKGYPR